LLGLRGAARFEPADLDVLGFLLTQCEHALSAMEAAGRYGRLAGDAMVTEVERSAGQVLVRLGLSGGRSQLPEVVDYHVGVAHMTCSRLRAVAVGRSRFGWRAPSPHVRDLGKSSSVVRCTSLQSSACWCTAKRTR